MTCFTPRSRRPKSLPTRGFLPVGLVLAVGVLGAGCSKSQAHSSPSTAAAVTEKRVWLRWSEPPSLVFPRQVGLPPPRPV